MTNFITFRRFNDAALAKELTERLAQSGIPFELEDNSSIFDPSFANNPLQKEINVKMRPDDFVKANEALALMYKEQLEHVGEDYYLFAFTDMELIEIISKPDEWGVFDYQLAQKLLKDRGLEIKPELASLLKEQRLQDLSIPESPNRYWVYLGYISAVMGGLIGLLIGWNLVAAKRTLPNGDRMYVYREEARNHGTRILLLSAFCVVGWLVVRYLFIN